MALRSTQLVVPRRVNDAVVFDGVDLGRVQIVRSGGGRPPKLGKSREPGVAAIGVVGIADRREGSSSGTAGRPEATR